MNFNNSPDDQNVHQTSSVIPDARPGSSFDVMGAQSDDVMGAQSDDVMGAQSYAGLMKTPDTDVACNNVCTYQVSFFLVNLKPNQEC